MEFEYVKETPKVGTKNRLEISSFLGPLFFTWVVQLLLPVSTNMIHRFLDKKILLVVSYNFIIFMCRLYSLPWCMRSNKN
jgi:hypothetical protein